MWEMDDKENETKQENERPSKSVVEPAGQKPRRSVLKEFDPFAPDSPCPPPKQKSAIIIDEEEVYEDAETSLTSYLCPRTQNTTNALKTPTKPLDVGRESILIPDLKGNSTEKPTSLNDTADLTFAEAVENLSLTDVAAHDKTSSEEDFEFNTKKQPRLPEIVQSSEDNIMVDSLEQAFNADSILTVENEQAPVIQNKSQSLANGLQGNSSDVKREVSKEVTQDTVSLLQDPENDQDFLNGDLLDSLEKQIILSEEIPTDSLEILKQEQRESINAENPTPLLDIQNVEKTPTTMSTDIPVLNDISIKEVSNQSQAENVSLSTETSLTEKGLKHDTTVEGAIQNTDATSKDHIESSVNDAEIIYSNQPNILQTDPTKRERLLPLSDKIDQEVKTNTSILDSAFEAPKGNIEPNKIPQDAVESQTDKHNRDNFNATVTILETPKLDTTFEAPQQNMNLNEIPPTSSLETVESLTAQTQSDQSNATVEASEASELDTAFEAPKKNREFTIIPQAPSSDPIESSTTETQSDQSTVGSSEIVKLDTTFEAPKQNNQFTEIPQAPPPEVVEIANSQTQCEQSNATVESIEPLKLDTTFEDPKQDIKLSKIPNALSSDEIKSQTSQPQNNQSNVTCETVTETEQTSDDLKIPKCDSTSVQLNQNENIIVDSLNQTTPSAKLNQTFDAVEVKSENIVINNEPDNTNPQTLTHSSEINSHNKSLSLRDIIDTSVKDVILSNNTEGTNSNDVNSTFITAEQATESSRVMEELAQSLNQTIDVEESAIEDINSSTSTNTSGEISKGSLNVTIENVKTDLDNKEVVTENKKDMRDKDHMETQKSRKNLERQETEEFEDLERQYDEKAQSSETCVKDKITVVDQDYNRVFQRQDTKEFEALERECKESMPSLNECDVKEENTCKSETEFDVEVKKENINQEKSTDEQKSQKVKIQTSDYKPATNLEVKQENTTSEENVEERVNDNNDYPVKPGEGLVKVRVSGNICTANTTSEESDQMIAQKPDEEPCDTMKDQDISKISSSSPTSSNDPSLTTEMNGSHDKSFKKTKEMLETENKPAKLNGRPECRPNIRSVRNKTQVINKPVFANNTDKDMADEANTRIQQELHQYKSKSDELKYEVDRLQSDIETLKKENMRKDKYILSTALEKENKRNNILKFRKLLEDFEKTILEQNIELARLKEESEKNAKHFTNTEMAFANVFEKYEKTKSVIEGYRKNEEILQQNIQRAEEQLTKMDAKFSVMREHYTEQVKKATNEVIQEKEKYRQDITKLQAMVKRLEIKALSLETSLKQKSEECQALSALCDDITGKPM